MELELADGNDENPILIPSNDPMTALGAVLPIQLIEYEHAMLREINPQWILPTLSWWIKRQGRESNTLWIYLENCVNCKWKGWLYYEEGDWGNQEVNHKMYIKY